MLFQQHVQPWSGEWKGMHVQTQWRLRMYRLSCYDLYRLWVCLNLRAKYTIKLPWEGLKEKEDVREKQFYHNEFEEYKKRRSMKELCPHEAQITIACLALTAFTDLLYLVRSVNRPFNDSGRNSRSIIIPNRPPSSSNSAAKLLLQLQLAAATAAQRPSNRFHLWQRVWFRCTGITSCSPG